MTALLKYDAACRAIAEAKAIDEVADIRNRAEAMGLYARQAKNKDLEVDAGLIRIRAERRLGQLELELKDAGLMHRGGRPAKTGSEPEPVSESVRLADIGIDKKLSSRAQKLAAVPEAKFEGMLGQYAERMRDEAERVSKDLLKEGEKAEKRAERQQAIEGGGTVEDLQELIDRGVTFPTFLADPPWDYETWSDRGQDRGAIQHYQTQPLDQIIALPVARLARRDAILHLWCPSSMLPQGLQVIEAWGFSFKKVGLIWNKLNASGEGRHMGPGKWTRDEAELCLLATRGAPRRLDAGVRQTFDAPIGKHSAKPEEFRDRIERLTDGPYLELYGRTPRDGWVIWGNQVVWRPPVDAAGNVLHHDDDGVVIEDSAPPAAEVIELPAFLAARGNPACTYGREP